MAQSQLQRLAHSSDLHAKTYPFIKWAGGKRALSSQIISNCPDSFGHYLEPFLGGGAVFFNLSPAKAILADVNQDLINVFTQVRDNVECVIEGLADLEISEEYYYRLRSIQPSDPLSRAVRFLYLNRTAFNGIYRVNRQGEFNVPFGCKPGTKLCEPNLLRAAGESLKTATLLTSDFEAIFPLAKAGDLIYADPPYTTAHDNNGFRRYNKNLFSWDDQYRLAQAAAQAASRGVKVVVSNAHHRDLKRLYQGFKALTLERPSCISGRTAARGTVEEYLFVSTQ